MFNDGDTSKNLAPENVRRFYAFSINERIEVDVYQSDEYIPGFIVGIYDDYDVDDDDDDQLYVRIDDSDEDIIKVSRSQLRRETEERREEREASESDESEDEIDDETEQFDDESED